MTWDFAAQTLRERSQLDITRSSVTGAVMEAWNRETERYRERVSHLSELLNVVGAQIDQMPRPPIPTPYSDVCALKYQVCLLIIGVARSTQELTASIHLLWTCGRFLSASLNIRLLIELLGLLTYCQQKILRKIETDTVDNINIATERMGKLLFASKSGVPFPDGRYSDYTPVNVMEFVRSAELERPGMESIYNFLCDAAHPTYSQHSYLLFSGSDYDNWSNRVFAEQAHIILERTVSAAELATIGIRDTMIMLFDYCLPQILAEHSAVGRS